MQMTLEGHRKWVPYAASMRRELPCGETGHSGPVIRHDQWKRVHRITALTCASTVYFQIHAVKKLPTYAVVSMVAKKRFFRPVRGYFVVILQVLVFPHALWNIGTISPSKQDQTLPQKVMDYPNFNGNTQVIEHFSVEYKSFTCSIFKIAWWLYAWYKEIRQILIPQPSERIYCTFIGLYVVQIAPSALRLRGENAHSRSGSRKPYSIHRALSRFTS
jgi:hypothetical protein